MGPSDSIYLNLDKQLYKIGGGTKNPDGSIGVNLIPVSPEEPINNWKNMGSGVFSGNVEVGGGYIQSGNFKSGVAGWRLDSSGNLEANDGTFRGTFIIGGTLVTVSSITELQTAITTVAAAGGGTVSLVPGTYVSTASITIPSNVAINGNGATLDFGGGAYQILSQGTNAYTTGTLTVAFGSTSVVGVGTTWTAGMVGRSILIGDYWYEITARADDTHITIGDAFIGVSVSGDTYVIADILSGISIENLTVTNSSIALIKGQYIDGFKLDNVSTVGPGTIGVDVDDVSAFFYSNSMADTLANGLTLDNAPLTTMTNFVVLNTTSHGVTLTRISNATISVSSFQAIGNCGVKFTNSYNTSFFSFSIIQCIGHGIELVSGNTGGIDIMSGYINTVGADGIRISASSNDTNISAVSFYNYLGYGIQIADSTSSRTQIVSPAFDGGGTGKISDRGTSTNIMPTLPLTFFRTSSIVPSSTINSYTDDFYYLPSLALTDRTIAISRKTGIEMRETTSEWADTDRTYSAIKLGSYLYVLIEDTAATPDEFRIYRYSADNLAAGGTLMTFSGTLPDLTVDTSLHLACDGTYFYMTYDGGNSANAWLIAKYSVSGTVFTYVSTITCGSATLGFATNLGVLSSGNIYTLDEGNDALSKFNSSGTLQYTEATSTQPGAFRGIHIVENTLYSIEANEYYYNKLRYTD